MVLVQLLGKSVHGHEGLSTKPGSVGRDKLTTSELFYHPIEVGVFAESSIVGESIERSMLHTAATSLRKKCQSLPRIGASSTEKLDRKRNQTKKIQLKPSNHEKSTDSWDTEGSGLERFPHLQYPNIEWLEESRRSWILLIEPQRILANRPERLTQMKKSELSKVSEKMSPGFRKRTDPCDSCRRFDSCLATNTFL